MSRARWSCLWRHTCGVKTAKRGRNSSLITVLNISWYVCLTIFFCKLLCKLLCLLNWIRWFFFIFIFRRPIIIGWWRDTGTIFPEFDPDLWMEVGLSGGPDKNRVYGLSNTTATTCGRPVVFQPLGAPNQYQAPNLRSSWPCSNTRLSSPTNTTTYQRSTHNSKRLNHNKEQSLNKSKRLKHN